MFDALFSLTEVLGESVLITIEAKMQGIPGPGILIIVYKNCVTDPWGNSHIAYLPSLGAQEYRMSNVTAERCGSTRFTTSLYIFQCIKNCVKARNS